MKNNNLLSSAFLQIFNQIKEENDVYCDDCREKTKRQQLYKTVIQFMNDQDITCEETIHQMDSVIENAYDFITDLFNIVKDDLK